MSKGGRKPPCGHGKCYSDKCLALSPEQYTPTEEDFALADELVEGGWISVSNRYRHVIRWKPPGSPPIEELLRPEVLNTYWGRELAKSYKQISGEYGLRTAPVGHGLYQERTLTVRQYKAFAKRRAEKSMREADERVAKWEAQKAEDNANLTARTLEKLNGLNRLDGEHE